MTKALQAVDTAIALREYAEQITATQATGCAGAGHYREAASRMGYAHLEVLDWTSSAGDWTFIVSKDGERWFLMSQTNLWPRRGFEWSVDSDHPFEGTAEEAVAYFWDAYF
jgi:hypothetical protein